MSYAEFKEKQAAGSLPSVSRVLSAAIPFTLAGAAIAGGRETAKGKALTTVRNVRAARVGGYMSPRAKYGSATDFREVVRNLSVRTKVARGGSIFKNKHFQQTAAIAGLGALGTIGTHAAIVGGPQAAKGIYSRLTERRDFSRMIKQNPDLQEGPYKEKNLREYFKTLRRFNPELSADPFVSGQFTRMMAGRAGEARPAYLEHHEAQMLTGNKDNPSVFSPQLASDVSRIFAQAPVNYYQAVDDEATARARLSDSKAQRKFQEAQNAASRQQTKLNRSQSGRQHTDKMTADASKSRLQGTKTGLEIDQLRAAKGVGFPKVTN